MMLNWNFQRCWGFKLKDFLSGEYGNFLEQQIKAIPMPTMTNLLSGCAVRQAHLLTFQA